MKKEEFEAIKRRCEAYPNLSKDTIALVAEVEKLRGLLKSAEVQLDLTLKAPEARMLVSEYAIGQIRKALGEE